MYTHLKPNLFVVSFIFELRAVLIVIITPACIMHGIWGYITPNFLLQHQISISERLLIRITLSRHSIRCLGMHNYHESPYRCLGKTLLLHLCDSLNKNVRPVVYLTAPNDGISYQPSCTGRGGGKGRTLLQPGLSSRSATPCESATRHVSSISTSSWVCPALTTMPPCGRCAVPWATSYWPRPPVLRLWPLWPPPRPPWPCRAGQLALKCPSSLKWLIWVHSYSTTSIRGWWRRHSRLWSWRYYQS